MEDAQGSSIQGERVAFGRLLWAGPLGAVSAAIANTIVYFVAYGLGAMPQDVVVEGSGPITLGPVIFASVVGAVGAVVIFAIVTLLARRRPIQTFNIVAAVALVLSFYTPFTIPEAPVAMVATLLLMHVVAGVVIVGVLTTLVRAR
jgi:hypothetical protein